MRLSDIKFKDNAILVFVSYTAIYLLAVFNDGAVFNMKTLGCYILMTGFTFSILCVADLIGNKPIKGRREHG